MHRACALNQGFFDGQVVDIWPSVAVWYLRLVVADSHLVRSWACMRPCYSAVTSAAEVDRDTISVVDWWYEQTEQSLVRASATECQGKLSNMEAQEDFKILVEGRKVSGYVEWFMKLF